ncbi:hypothetical protein C8R46DRAFT_1050921 [Mycena filopes]|nr:hypothetical protein C8R46DRAFT_1050921 [Mycena filopes]
MSPSLDLPVASILAVRYMSAVGVAVILYDHFLTWVDEVHLIWFNSKGGKGDRISFIVNRYMTEAMILYVAYGILLVLGGNSNGLSNQSCQTFIWVFGVVGSVSASLQQYTMVARVYTLWDRRDKIRRIVVAAFALQTLLTTVFSILTAHQLQLLIVEKASVLYIEPTHMCGITSKPWPLIATTGTLAAFGLFIIIMTIGNALDRPYQKQADIVNSLIADGARIFIISQY